LVVRATEAVVSFAEREDDGGLGLAEPADEGAGFADGLRVEGDGDWGLGAEIPEDGLMGEFAGEALESESVETDLGTVAMGMAAFLAWGDEV